MKRLLLEATAPLAALLVFANIAIAEVPGATINAGHGGHWIDTDNPGQGIIVEVLPQSRQLALAWFTWAEGAPGDGTGHRWFTGLGGFEGDTAEISLFLSTGGAFAGPDPVDTSVTGQAIFRISSCDEAVLEYEFPGGPGGAINLAKITETGACTQLSGHDFFPTYAKLRAEAEAEFGDGFTVECLVDYFLEVELDGSSGGERRYTGTMGGEINRTVLDASGAGVSFFGDGFTPVEIVIAGSTLAIVSTYEQPSRLPKEEDSRFWSEITLFRGQIDAEGNVTGSWRCFPLDTRGDDSLIATGQWRLEPITD